VNRSPCHRLAILAPAILALARSDGARATDLALSPAPAPYDWSGYYFGSHIGVMAGTSAWSAPQPGGPNLSGSLDFFQAFNGFNGAGSQFAGVSAGYNYALPSRFVVGAVADISFPGALAPNQGLASSIIGGANYADTIEMFGSVRARIGREVGHWLYYVTGGMAWTYEGFNRTTISPGSAAGPPPGTVDSAFVGRLGWTVGAGVEAPVAPHWTAKVEYLYSRFGDTAVPLGGRSSPRTSPRRRSASA